MFIFVFGTIPDAGRRAGGSLAFDTCGWNYSQSTASAVLRQFFISTLFIVFMRNLNSTASAVLRQVCIVV